MPNRINKGITVVPLLPFRGLMIATCPAVASRVLAPGLVVRVPPSPARPSLKAIVLFLRVIGGNHRLYYCHLHPFLPEHNVVIASVTEDGDHSSSSGTTHTHSTVPKFYRLM